MNGNNSNDSHNGNDSNDGDDDDLYLSLMQPIGSDGYLNGIVKGQAYQKPGFSLRTSQIM